MPACEGVNMHSCSLRLGKLCIQYIQSLTFLTTHQQMEDNYCYWWPLSKVNSVWKDAHLFLCVVLLLVKLTAGQKEPQATAHISLSTEWCLPLLTMNQCHRKILDNGSLLHLISSSSQPMYSHLQSQISRLHTPTHGTRSLLYCIHRNLIIYNKSFWNEFKYFFFIQWSRSYSSV